MKITKHTVVGRKYVQHNGQTCIELVRLSPGTYIVARNGQIQDAREKLTTTEAAEVIDGMKIRSGDGENEDAGIVDRMDDGSLSVRWDSLVVTPFAAKEIDNLSAL